MYCLMLLLATFMVGQLVSTASISSTEEGIRNNLIDYGDNSEVLLTPLMEPKNGLQLDKPVTNFENPYVVEIHSKYLSIKTTGLPPQKIKLNEDETEGFQKLSLSFVQLLNSSKLSSKGSGVDEETPEWNEVYPVITLTNSGVSLQFLNASDVETNATEMSSDDRRILWDFLTKYARNIFEEKIKELKLSEKFAEVVDPPADQTGQFAFPNFIEFLWSIMKLSVDYAETAFQGWTTSEPETTAPEVEKKFRSTTMTLFAYEEPSPFHEFPSQEFLYRRKGIDYIFYGRGVI